MVDRPLLATRLLICAGVAGIADALALLAKGVAPSLGTLFFGIAGVPCIAWGLWRRRHAHAPLPWPRALKRALAAALAAWAASVLLFTVLVLSAARDESSSPAGVALVLGAGLRGERMTLTLARRMQVAAAYLRAHPRVTALVSGGQGAGESRTEAAAMADYLVAHGVAPERIVREERSTSTWENLRFSQELLRELPGPPAPVLIVTSDFHVPRALLLGRRLGLEVRGLPCPTPWYTYPNNLVREYFAFASSWLFDRV